MLIPKKEDIQLVTEFPCFWDTLYEQNILNATWYNLKINLSLQFVKNWFLFQNFWLFVESNQNPPYKSRRRRYFENFFWCPWKRSIYKEKK